MDPAPRIALGLRGYFSPDLSMTLILASTSPIRRAMLAAAGVEFDAVAPGVEEETLKSTIADPADLATTLAVAKAEAVSVAYPGAWTIGSDSVVSVANRLFGKPADRGQAVEHLRFFSGKEILLDSAAAIARGGTCQWHFVGRARLRVRELSERFIANYLDAEWPEVRYCVGVFRMEGRGVQLFESITGDHFTILGMPLLPVLGALRERGLVER